MTDWSTGVCETNGINIHYVRTGGSKPPLVLLHGLTANGACWSVLARALEGEYDVIMPDARGHGTSSAPDHGYRYEDHADDVVGFMKVLDLSAPILLGHSMGGMTAAVVASREPHLLRGLILADPTFLSAARQQEVFEGDSADQHRHMLNTALHELVEESGRKHPGRSSATLEFIARARLQTSLRAFDVLRPPNPDYMRLMSAIDVPCLVVIGDAGVVSPAVAAEMQRVNPRIHVEQIPEAGHGVHYDQPERFTAAVKSFLCSRIHGSVRTAPTMPH